MWPGLVGKGNNPGQEPPIPLEQMLNLTAAARGPNGERFEGVDLFLFLPHIDPAKGNDDILRAADAAAAHGLRIGSLVAPVWAGTMGGSAMGSAVETGKFLKAVRYACQAAVLLRERGYRDGGVIRVDSATSPEAWSRNPDHGTKRIIDTFSRAASIAADHGERLAAEGEICWGGMHSWKHMLNVLEGVGKPGTFGFQADLAHTFLFLLGYNAPEHAFLKEGYHESAFAEAYPKMVEALRPWTTDFHVAQNDGTVKGGGDHDKTGRHCPADDPNGKMDITWCSGQWLQDAASRGISHICWDGCLFPNETLLKPETWDTILATMVKVRDAHGWS